MGVVSGTTSMWSFPSEAGAPGKCGRLLRWLYDMQEAAQAWEADYTAKQKREGFVEGVSPPTVFFNASTGTRCVVHGDDFMFLVFFRRTREYQGTYGRLLRVKSQGDIWYR